MHVGENYGGLLQQSRERFGVDCELVFLAIACRVVSRPIGPRLDQADRARERAV